VSGSENHKARSDSSVEGLHRHLGFPDLYALSVGSVIGTGIFFLPGKAARDMGPAAAVALLIGAVLAGLLVLCYAEAGSRFRGTGGAMRYGQAAFGDLVGFEIGWATWIARVVSWAALATAFVRVLGPLWADAEEFRTALIIGLVGLLTVFNLRGIRMGGRLNTVLTAGKLIPLIAFIIIGAFHLDGSRFTPFAPQGFGDLGATTVFMLYAYVGFEGMVIPAAEMRDPKRNVPRALLLGMGTVIILYAGVWAVCTGTLPGLAESKNPVGDAAANFLGPAGTNIILVGIAISVVGINAFMALVTPRALYALSHEGLLPTWIGGVSERRVPTFAIVATSGAVLALAVTGSFEGLAVISVVARIAQYVPTCFAVLKMRRQPELPPAEFRVPFGPVVPLVAVGVCAWLLVETPRDKLLWGAVAVLSGLALYLPWRLLTGTRST